MNVKLDIDPVRFASKATQSRMLNATVDDLAIQGCRPEFVRHEDRWLLATADQGQENNAVRLYQPAILADAKSTSEPSVRVEEFPCGPWTQQLHSSNAQGLLMLVQNQIEGHCWRPTPTLPRKPDGTTDFRSVSPYDEISDRTEMEGFTREYCALVSSTREDNVTIARLKMVNRPGSRTKAD